MGSVKKLSNFVIRRIKGRDMEKIIRILANSFMTEPTLAYTDIRREENEQFVRLLADNIVSDDLTLIAETTDGTAAGVTMSLDFATVPPADFIDYTTNHRHFSKVVRMLEQLEEHYSKMHGFEHGSMPRGHSVHMFMLGTEPAFRQMGIAKALRGAALEHYNSKKYRFAMSEASSLFTRRVCYKFGFETVLRLPYAELFSGGEMEQSISDGHDAVHLMVKELK